MMETHSPASSAFLDLGSRAYLIELFPWLHMQSERLMV